jgi:hypothetical protein
MVGDCLIKINNYYYNNNNLPRFSPLSEIAWYFATHVFGMCEKAPERLARDLQREW